MTEEELKKASETAFKSTAIAQGVDFSSSAVRSQLTFWTDAALQYAKDYAAAEVLRALERVEFAGKSAAENYGNWLPPSQQIAAMGDAGGAMVREIAALKAEWAGREP